MRDRADIYHDEFSKRRRNCYQKKRNHDDETIFIKIDFIEHRKKKNSKNEQKKIKNEKKCYKYDREDHFA